MAKDGVYRKVKEAACDKAVRQTLSIGGRHLKTLFHLATLFLTLLYLLKDDREVKKPLPWEERSGLWKFGYLPKRERWYAF